MRKQGERVVVITGTSRGLGRGLAELFARTGATVVGCSRGETAVDLPNYHHSVIDVTDEALVRTWARDVKRRFGRVDLLVCNVGLVRRGAFAGLLTLEVFESFVRTILTGTFLVCREFSKIMALQQSGRIVNVTSIMTELHAPGTSGYSSAKAAVVEFSKVLARELATTGVTCNVLSPSVIAGEASEAFGEKWMQDMLSMQTLQRTIDISELYEIIEFFASPGARCVTGQVLHTCLVD